MEKKDETNTGDQKGLAYLLQHHKRLVMIGGAVLGAVVIGALVYVLIGLGNGEQALTPPENDVPTVMDGVYGLLPETERPLGGEAAAAMTELPRDPFAGPMALTGLVLGGRSGGLAIIESGDTAYIVKQEDRIAELWTVAEIGPDFVRLTNDEDQELRLELTGR